jgi:AhpD family alkylhydroperoxidase
MRIKQFNKRRYRSFVEFWSDLRLLFSDFKKIKRVGLISPAFREKLMMAVTAVYGCSYCSWLHTTLALRTGIDREEITRLLSSSVGNCPEDEAIALLYAQHWADSNANPQPEFTQRLVEAYGSEKAKAINLLLRMNRMGNLVGNSFDYLLYRISSGRVGKDI